METIEVIVPIGMYSKEVVVRAAHRHSHFYFVEPVLEGEFFRIRLTPKSEDTDTAFISRQVSNDLLDEALRESVRVQAGPIQEVLLRAALIGATAGTAT